MNKTTNLLVAILLTGSIGVNNGICGSDPTFLEKGQQAPFSGILFSEDKAQRVRNDLLEADKTKLLLETEKHRAERLGQILSLKDEEIELYAKQNQRLLKTNERSDTLNYMWFGLGILFTSLAVYGAGSLK